MSNLSGPINQLTRRHWLGHLAASALGVAALQFFSSLQAQFYAKAQEGQPGSCIVLWMGGGPSHPTSGT